MLPVAHTSIATHSPWEKIWQGVVEIFEIFKERLSFYWDAFVSWASATSTSFFLFRIAEFIHPSLVSPIERGYLYVTQFFNDVFSQQREADLTRLTTEVAELRALVQRMGVEKRSIEDEHQTLTSRYAQAQIRMEFLETCLNYSSQDLVTQEHEIAALRGALVANREIATPLQIQLERADALNQPLQDEVTALVAERDALQRQVDALLVYVQPSPLRG